MGHGFSHLYKMQPYKLNKKGVSSLRDVAIVLLVVGVILGFTFIFLNTLTDDMSDTSATVYNETITPINGTPVWVANNYSSIDCYSDFSVTEAMDESNSTDGAVHSGNYSTNPAGTILWNGLEVSVDHNWNVTYTYKYDDSGACIGVEETIEGIAKLPTWLGLVVLLLIIGVLLGLIYKHIQPRGGGTTAEI